MLKLKGTREHWIGKGVTGIKCFLYQTVKDMNIKHFHTTRWNKEKNLNKNILL